MTVETFQLALKFALHAGAQAQMSQAEMAREMRSMAAKLTPARPKSATQAALRDMGATEIEVAQ